MDVYRTEEEQLAALKGWWQKNGSSLLIGIGLALAIVFGWKAWQQHQATQQAAAAASYQNVIDALSFDADKRTSTIAFVSDALRKDYPDSGYALLASLIEARQLMDAKNPAEAINRLIWAQSHIDLEKPLGLIVTIRLARAQLANEQADAALATLETIPQAGAFEAMRQELKGDILHTQGNLEAATAAYLAARQASGSDRAPILDLKLSDLGVARQP